LIEIASARRAESRPCRSPAATSGGEAPSSGPRPRHPEFDALRGTAILLVVTLHAALAYTRVDIPRLLWGVREPSPHAGFDLLSWWAMGVSVPLFFAMGGFFAARIEEERGPSAFLRNRARRLVLPMLVAAPVILPLCFFAWAEGWLATGRCTFAEISRMRFFDPLIATDLYGPAHLWFLEYLVPMLGAFGWIRKARAGRAARDRPGRAGRWCRKRIRADRPGATTGEGSRAWRWILGPWAPLAAAVPSTALLLISRHGSAIDAALDRHNSFIPDPIRLLHFGLFFAFGVGLHRVRAGLETLAARGWWCLAASIPAFGARAWLLPRDWSGQPGGGASLALAASGALFSWLAVFGLIGVYRRHFGRPSPTVRYLAEASFWIYLVHLPIVGLIQADLHPAPIPTALKFAIVWAITLALGLSSYHVLVRRTALGRFLGGSAAPRAAPATG